MPEDGHFKDAVLDRLAGDGNVAQFVSFSPDCRLQQRFSRVRGYPPNHVFESARSAVSSLLDASASLSVNIRSFHPLQPQANEFIYGLTDGGEVVLTLERIAGEGLHTIVNETIDIADGGVSGVILDDVIEFAPEDTPRAVEKPGIAAFSTDLGLQILEIVYGVAPRRPGPGSRVEFSLHPLRTGYRGEHVILWESEKVDAVPPLNRISWPNRFSRFLGDKVFGLLIAHLFGFRVPETLAIPRKLAPFRFGTSPGTTEVWTRTSPPEPVPGKFTTRKGYVDAFKLIQQEDPSGQEIASVLVQRAVESRFAGAAATQAEGSPLIEGVAGTGEAFMQGAMPPTELPGELESEVRETSERLFASLGPVRFEWAHDLHHLWVLQLQASSEIFGGQTIYPGRAVVEHRFDVQEGLEALRSLAESLIGSGEGIVLAGSVGVTSHFGDVLRRARIPSRIDSS
jgi:hypothetical protein